MLARGQIYIGLIIASAIFLILSHTIFTLILSGFDLVSFTRARTDAQAVATEKIEIIKNLPYEDVGTEGGIPNGVLLQEETIIKNGLPFEILTSVVYIDDPFDQLAPDDTLPIDYKRARVDVSWGGIAASKSNTITLISDIAPRGIESIDGGGTITVLVYDSSGLPVPQATVQIIADGADPPVNLAIDTNDNGRVTLPGAPECTNCYEITVTKDGFSTDRTYSTDQIANPINPHQTVLESEITETSFAIDRFATLQVQSVNDRDNSFAVLPNQQIRIQGSKIIGTDDFDQDVYKFDQTVITDGSGSLSIDEIEWDTYTVSLPDTSTQEISGTNPLNPLAVLPEEDISLLVALSSQSDNSLLTIFTDEGGLPVASVSANLTDTGSFDETLISGESNDPDYGQVFFKDLEIRTYTLEATASGYLDTTGDIDVNGYTTVQNVLSIE